MTHWQIRRGTSNVKLGPGAYVITLDARTCPATCPLKGSGCYAESGPLAIHWRRVSRGESRSDDRTAWSGKGFRSLARTLRHIGPSIPEGALLRVGDAGDPSYRGRLSVELLDALGHLKVTRGIRPIVYSHAPDSPENRRAVERARALGVTVNRSHHGPLELQAAGDPWERVTTVPRDFWPEHGGSWIGKPTGILRCPAETRDSVTCDSCGLCARPRGYAIGFTAHGSSARKVEAASRG